MEEKLKALMFYRILKRALESDGIDKILVTPVDGELQADIVDPSHSENLDGWTACHYFGLWKY